MVLLLQAVVSRRRFLNRAVLVAAAGTGLSDASGNNVGRTDRGGLVGAGGERGGRVVMEAKQGENLPEEEVASSV